MTFRNEYMETYDIHNLNTHNNYQVYCIKNIPIKNNINEEKGIVRPEMQKNLSFYNTNTQDGHAQRLDSPIPYKSSLWETEVTMSVEKDLNIVVTTVKNKNTDTVIRQIPEEEIIERLKYLKKYNKQLNFSK